MLTNRGTDRPDQDDQPKSGLDSLCSFMLVIGIVFSFWLLFSSYFVTFYRDDNVGASCPVLVDQIEQILRGSWPDRTYYLGGGGGAHCSLVLSGLLNPFFLFSALIIRHNLELLTNVICSIHLALFAGGAFFLGKVLRSPNWIAFIGALSLGFSGFSFVWMGNWATLVIPYVFLPWLVGGLVLLANSEGFRQTVLGTLLTGFSLIEVFVSGLPHAAFFQVFLTIPVLLWLLGQQTAPERKLFLQRLLLPVSISLAFIIPIYFELHRFYTFLGTHKSRAADFYQLSVPLQSYLGLLIPQIYSSWLIPWVGQALLLSTLVAGPLIPAWFLVITVSQQKRDLLNDYYALLIGLFLLVLFLSPLAFSLLLPHLPILSAFRWPFRGLPVLHIMVVFLFFIVYKKFPQPCMMKNRYLLIGLSLILAVILPLQEFVLFKSKLKSLPTSWFSISPALNDNERWSPRATDLLQNNGYLAVLCSSEETFWKKPGLFMYGNFGAQYKIPTLHVYMSPQIPAYRRIGMVPKGNIENWNLFKPFLENSLHADPGKQLSWENRFGPQSVDELASKTYISAVVVDADMKEPIDYFYQSANWNVVEKRDDAVLFIRKPNLKQLN